MPSLEEMATTLVKQRHDNGSRFKLPHSPKGMSRIHQDLHTSSHQTGSAMNGAGTALLRRAMPLGRKLHVGVVGGGVAGLRCAELLLRHGVQVTVIEGRDRLGGRLGQGTMKGKHLVDLGPNWIHGTDNNPIMDLARETGTTAYSWGEKQITVDSHKRALPEQETSEIQEFIWETIKEAFDESNSKFSREPKDDQIPSSKSLADFFSDKIKERFGYDKHPESATKMELVEQSTKMWGCFVGQRIEKQSLKFFWLEECLDGDNLFCADSYYKVLNRLAAPAIESATVKFGRTVRTIRSKSNELGGSFPSLAHHRSSSEHAKAGTNGEVDENVEESFDEIVVTTPLGWLKQNQHVFAPPLPKRMSEAISALGYGNLDKVYISFPTAFWNEPTEDGTAAATTTEQQRTVPNVTATTVPIHQSVDSDITSHKLKASDRNYAGFVTYLKPEYARDTNPSLSNQEAMSFAALPESCAQPTLLFYIHSEFTDQVGKLVSTLPHRPLAGPATPEYMSALWPLFQPYVSFLPNYDPASADCKPVDMLATAWVNDELAGNGSYTNFPVGLEKGDEDVEMLREGMPEAGVWFAGEHTAPFVALGTVTGAYWAGEGVARRILRAYGVEVEAEKMQTGNGNVENR